MLSLRKSCLLLSFHVVVSILCLKAQSIVPEWNNNKIKASHTIPIRAYAFPIHEVKLLPGSPFYKARSLDSAYLRLLRPDRLLYRFYKHAGLTPKDSIYGGWESEGLSGHTLGHYLSAAAMMYASTRDPLLKHNIDYTIDQLTIIQDARKTGYLGAIPGEDSIFKKVASGRIKASSFDLNGGWSPWYTVHKIMSGLCDVYYYTANRRALYLVSRMADWVYQTIDHLPDSTRLVMLNCEYGGMNEVLANVYSLTGNKKYLDLSYKFKDEVVMGKLANGIDPMPGKHSNTNVPKAIGSARQYELTGQIRDQKIASFFWQSMVDHHSYVIGGNSNYEYCGEQDQLNDRLSDNTCETCNTYNMLKLTRHLFAWSPEARYMDYYERALYNHILASQHPENGMMCYFVPLRMGTQKTFSDTFNTFTCCVGSGMENHSKYQEQIFSHDGKQTVFVNLFIPATLNWKSNKLELEQTTRFPASNEINLTLKSNPIKHSRIAIRQPFWSKSLLIEINDQPYSKAIADHGYLLLDHHWKKNDRIDIIVTQQIYSEAMPDNPDRIALKYGPLVLAGQLGEDKPGELDVPVLLTPERNVTSWMVREPGSLEFKMNGVGKPRDIHFKPFYQVYDEYYSVYFDFYTQTQWDQLVKDHDAEVERLKSLEAHSVDYFIPGIKEDEKAHVLTHTERSYVDAALGRPGREARADHFFEFQMKVDPSSANQLVLTYLGDDKNRIWDLVIEGNVITTVHWPGGKTGKFYDVYYNIPIDLIQSKSSIQIRINANQEKTAGRIFGVRTIRKE
ncbi:MAG: glycoside hydrolase family 127 protein [Saprospiraceae bacterium]|nr:glycoside hydrolase family 127 protein [Saprospiraceae bacterium]